ncbi:hypothetical protein [Maribellus maritimus]|uniref:hypothetical protein n=1 Tax=Maribellus maritimus TaxID=2870838 RepID=UPI001EEC4B7C|nr:hypothetical protein [Maribellus maritimus]MCG6190471.1 hypothetical protein [Maribellus maritimus]
MLSAWFHRLKKWWQVWKRSIYVLMACFINADSGFDTEDFRRYLSEIKVTGNIDQNWRNGTTNENLFDELLYECRFVVERTNAWMDAFKAILVRFEISSLHRKALSLLAFIVILLRKL